MGVLTLIAESNKEATPGKTLDSRRLVHLSDKPGEVRRNRSRFSTLLSRGVVFIIRSLRDLLDEHR